METKTEARIKARAIKEDWDGYLSASEIVAECLKETTAERDSLLSVQKQLVEALELAQRELDALWSFYGIGLQVAEWHKNGALEPLDNFFEENDFKANEAIIAAILAAKASS